MFLATGVKIGGQPPNSNVIFRMAPERQADSLRKNLTRTRMQFSRIKLQGMNIAYVKIYPIFRDFRSFREPWRAAFMRRRSLHGKLPVQFWLI
jgi:hypothetical protein